MKKNLFISVLSVLNFLLAEVLTVKYFQQDVRYIYRTKLLELALEKTVKTDGPFKLQASDITITQARGLIFLETGETDIASLPTTVEREAKFLPVKIPILQGILGYRVFLIRKDQQNKFNEISSLDELNKKLTAGFCSQWADMAILTENKIPTIGTATYDNLFEMLSAQKFDYFPRGINEAWGEIKTNEAKYPDLAVEEKIAFYYPYPVYFFVNKKNTALAARIERGLNIALKDGSFKKLFLEHHAELIKQANLSKRKIFTLKNQLLPPGSPLPDTGWWLKQ